MQISHLCRSITITEAGSMTLRFRQRSAYLRTVTDTRLLKLRIQTALYGRETFLPIIRMLNLRMDG